MRLTDPALVDCTYLMTSDVSTIEPFEYVAETNRLRAEHRASVRCSTARAHEGRSELVILERLTPRGGPRRSAVVVVPDRGGEPLGGYPLAANSEELRHTSHVTGHLQLAQAPRCFVAVSKH